MKFDYVYGTEAWNMYPDVTVSIEVITPETASKMLESNIGNRAMKREALDKAITDNEWTLNGATIVFSDEGVLLDGQNRLNACVKTGIPIVSIVVRGIKQDAQLSMDSGVKRLVSDFLKIKGYKDVNVVAAIGSALLQADAYGIDSSYQFRRARNTTTKATVDFIERNYESRIKPILRDCDNTRKRYKGLRTNTIAPIYEAFRNTDIESYKRFVGMVTGEYEAAKPVRLLMNRLNENAQSKSGYLPQRMIGALIIKAWNAYMRGEEPQKLTFAMGGARAEHFPEIFKGWE